MRTSIVIRTLGTAALVVLSAGWLLPAAAALHYLIGYLEEVLNPRLRGLEPMTDFDFLLELSRMSTLTLLWLGAAVSFWAGAAAWRLLSAKRTP